MDTSTRAGTNSRSKDLDNIGSNVIHKSISLISEAEDRTDLCFGSVESLSKSDKSNISDAQD